jgi:hypothetical protein
MLGRLPPEHAIWDENDMLLMPRLSPLQRTTIASHWRVGLAILVLLVLCRPLAAPAQDQSGPAATPDMVRVARETAAADRAVAEQQLTRAARYRELEINALHYAEHATDPAGRRSWLDSAREHAGTALRLEEHSRLLRAKADAAEAHANELEAAFYRRQSAPQSQDTY